jgi:hypothetical protein
VVVLNFSQTPGIDWAIENAIERTDGYTKIGRDSYGDPALVRT